MDILLNYFLYLSPLIQYYQISLFFFNDIFVLHQGLKYTEAELQQELMSLKRCHRDQLELIRKEQDEALFKLRGEQAVLSEHYVDKIQQLEEQIKEWKASGAQAKETQETDKEVRERKRLALCVT